MTHAQTHSLNYIDRGRSSGRRLAKGRLADCADCVRMAEGAALDLLAALAARKSHHLWV